jgi:hypothetical protein
VSNFLQTNFFQYDNAEQTPVDSMRREDKILEEIWSNKIEEWDRIYGTLPESLATHYGHNGATQIMINAKGQGIDIVIEDRLMPYKFEGESEDCYRITVEHMTIEELECVLRELK